jgi:hypothetical protein
VIHTLPNDALDSGTWCQQLNLATWSMRREAKIMAPTRQRQSVAVKTQSRKNSMKVPGNGSDGLCPYGSGRKFKNCCLGRPESYLGYSRHLSSFLTDLAGIVFLNIYVVNLE